MKTQVKVLSVLILSLLGFGEAYGQVNVDLKIKNQRIIGDSYYFDVYMERTGSNNLYLGNADFAFTFDHANFSSPTFNHVASTTVLQSSNSTDVSANYEANIATSIGSGLSANRLIINVQPPAFSSGNFASTIAEIDNTAETHFLGTFYVTGMTDISQTPNLSWVTGGTGIRTKVYTINSSTLKSSLATINTVDPTIITAPSTQVSGLTVLSYDTSTITLKWDRGNGSNMMLLVKEDSVVGSNLPTDGMFYTANDTFGSGSQIGSTGVYVVYSGTDTTITIKGLSSATTYHFAAVEYSGSDGVSENYYLTDADTISATTLTAEPTVQASTLIFTSTSSTSHGLKWNSGNGSNYLVVAKQGSAPAGTPDDGTGYTADATFANGQDSLATGEYVVYGGTDTVVTVTGLDPATQYYYAVYTFNGSGNTSNYLLTSPATNNKYTYSTEPDTAPSALAASNITGTTMDLNWVGGNGTYHIVVAKEGSAPSTAPSDGGTYTASFIFADGQDSLATGEYVMYAGTDTAVSIAGLSNTTTYHYAVYTYNYNGSEATTANYLATAATASATTLNDEPTVAASNLTFTDTSSSTLELIWNSGDGASYLVIAKAGEAPAATPEDTTAYTANAAFGTTGTDIATGEYVVYSGTDTTVNVTGLSAATQYYFEVYTFNGSTSSINYLTSSSATGNAYTHSADPSTAPSSVTASDITTTGTTISWVEGDGGYSIVVAKEGSAPSNKPFDGVIYTGSADFSEATEIAASSGEYVIYAGTDTTVAVTSLTAGTEYYYAVYTYNYDGTNSVTANYYPTAGTTSATTLTGEPTIASNNMEFTAQTTNSLSLRWTKGNGSGRIVVAKEGSAPAGTPDDATAYSADATFDNGQDSVGVGEYVVYNGTDSVVTVSGLAQNTTYYFTVYEYNGSASSLNYLTSSSLTDNENTYLSLDVTVALEGAYNTTEMTTDLNTGGYLANTSQPFSGAPWNYAGADSITTVPNANVVDWVLVELRASSQGADSATTATIRKAGLLLKDGSIVEVDGSSALEFEIADAATYYVVVHHRNHIPVMSASAISFSSTDYVYNFTTAETQVYKPAALSDYTLVEVASGVYGMISGSAENTVSVLSIGAADRSAAWDDKNQSGYYMTDVNLDGLVDATDRSIILNNATRSSQLPE